MKKFCNHKVKREYGMQKTVKTHTWKKNFSKALKNILNSML